MPRTLLSVLAVLSLAGCLAPATETVAPASQDPAAPLPAPVLYLAADGTLAAEAPSEEGYVTLGDAVNSPMAEDYPVWTGTAPGAGNVSSAKVVFFVTTNTAAVAANTVMPFFPRFMAGLDAGEESMWGDGDGPLHLVAGQVAEVAVDLSPEDAFTLAAGDALALEIVPIYSHVKAAAEIRILVGPDHPARVEFG